jgi:hypothetical protein
MRKLFVLVGLAVTGALLIPGTAVAQEPIITIPIDTVARESGVLATAPVPAELQGSRCNVQADAENQSSVHPGNDLIVASGSDSETLFDVEREAGVLTTASGELTLGSEVTVSLSLGPDGIFSGGITVTIGSCETVTTTTPPPSESTTTTTSSHTTTTTTQPPTTTTGSPTEGPTSTTTTTGSPTEGPTSTTTTTGSSTVGPTSTTRTTTPVVAPTTVRPGGTAFTGVENVVPLGAIALMLMTGGSGLLWLGSRGRRNEDVGDE